MVSSLGEILHWIVLAASFVASAPKFTFSQGFRQQSVAPTRSPLKQHYLVRGIDDVDKGRDCLDIEKYAAPSSETGHHV